MGCSALPSRLRGIVGTHARSSAVCPREATAASGSGSATMRASGRPKGSTGNDRQESPITLLKLSAQSRKERPALYSRGDANYLLLSSVSRRVAVPRVNLRISPQRYRSYEQSRLRVVKVHPGR